MKYELVGDENFSLMNIHLDRGEKVKIESGAMVYMRDIELTGKMNTNKGILSAVGRTVTTGEHFFMSEAAGKWDNAVIAIAPPVSGELKILHVDQEHQYRLNTGSFLASDIGVDYVLRRQKLSRAIFGGTGGLFVAETIGEGDIVISSYGSLIEVKVVPGNPVHIDNQHVVAWDANLDYELNVASGIIGFKSGEGIVTKFSGTGSVWVQTRNISALALALLPFLPINLPN